MTEWATPVWATPVFMWTNVDVWSKYVAPMTSQPLFPGLLFFFPAVKDTSLRTNVFYVLDQAVKQI